MRPEGRTSEALFGTGFGDLYFSNPGQADVPLLSLVNVAILVHVKNAGCW